MTDEELAALERQCAKYELVHYSEVLLVIAALRAARGIYAKDMATMQMRVDHARLNQRTDDERELWEAGKAERDQLRAELAATNRELERWRHGVTIEGDFVCPLELEAVDLRAEVSQLRPLMDKMTLPQLVAERIATYVATETGQDVLAADIRSGAWRKP